MATKIINKKTKVVKEVPNEIAYDYLGTGEYELFVEKKVEVPIPKKENPIINNYEYRNKNK